MKRKAYLTPAVLSHSVIRFETDVSSACGDSDKDGQYENGVYVDNDNDGN
ncbi:hypothetical protein [Alicyclobacillus mengziensis]|uniref:Uncharacterized protein n=1 Tax=Alicyclobacillus mengziensis TaxID=2931921 RepID=A0A9X7VV14_9BACL|nr:hypothetical protein [Alicyclobacillus mengziensis]QSO45457.1 hypothetical protein JZ786_12810 [Alicyclobacillus mengziensis]